MELFRSLRQLPASAKGAAIAIGNFDGVHRGHQAILETTRTLAQSLGAAPAVLTFEPHPRMFFQPASPSIRLYPFRKKAELLAREQVAYCIAPRFNQPFSAITAENFVAEILAAKLGAAHIIVGEDFIFGHKRSGNAAYLQQRLPAFGIGLTLVKPVMQGSALCSSTAIRNLLSEPDLAGASAMLGRRYAVEGRVSKGQGRGRTIGFPTANIDLAGRFLPKKGVYAVKATVDGTTLKGVANLGIRPTFGGTHPFLESHFFDFGGDLYGKRLEVELTAFLREEKKFDSPESLKAQIAQDSQKARQMNSCVC